MDLTLLVPGLFWVESEDLNDEYLVQKKLPALDQIVRVSDKRKDNISLSQFYKRFLPESSFLEKLKTHLNLPKDGWYGLASPVHQYLNYDCLLLSDDVGLVLTKENVQNLIEDLNEFTKADGWFFYPVLADLWVWRSEQPVISSSFVPVCDVVGQRMDSFFTVEYEPCIKRLLTEIQMFLHTHPHNQERQKHSLPMINSLWLWHDLPSEGADISDSLIFADHLWWKIMHPCLDVPDNCSLYLQYQALHPSAQKRHVILLEDLLSAYKNRDIWDYFNRLESLEQRFFQPALAALKAGDIRKLTIAAHGQNGGEYIVTKNHLMKFWHFYKPGFTGKFE